MMKSCPSYVRNWDQAILIFDWKPKLFSNLFPVVCKCDCFIPVICPASRLCCASPQCALHVVLSLSRPSRLSRVYASWPLFVQPEENILRPLPIAQGYSVVLWARYFVFMVSHSIYTWIPANCESYLSECFGVTCIRLLITRGVA